MTTQQIIGELAAWLREGVCTRFAFKRATACDDEQAENYRFELVPPAVYEMSMPHDAAEWSEDDASAPINAPCIVVTAPSGGSHDLRAHSYTIPITLHIQLWNPGLLTEDENGVKHFTPTSDGWRDAVTLADAIRSDIADSLTVAGCAVPENIEVSFPEMDAFDPAAVYWRASVSFTLTRPITDNKINPSLL